jgi:hypothetical protein
MVFQSSIESHTDAQNMLLAQILKAAKLPFESADALHVSSVKPNTQFETLFSFGDTEQINLLLDKQAVKTRIKVDLPSLHAIAKDGKCKALAWKAVKAFLLTQR